MHLEAMCRDNNRRALSREFGNSEKLEHFAISFLSLIFQILRNNLKNIFLEVICLLLKYILVKMNNEKADVEFVLEF